MSARRFFRLDSTHCPNLRRLMKQVLMVLCPHVYLKNLYRQETFFRMQGLCWKP